MKPTASEATFDVLCINNQKKLSNTKSPLSKETNRLTTELAGLWHQHCLRCAMIPLISANNGAATVEANVAVIRFIADRNDECRSALVWATVAVNLRNIATVNNPLHVRIMLV